MAHPTCISHSCDYICPLVFFFTHNRPLGLSLISFRMDFKNVSSRYCVVHGVQRCKIPPLTWLSTCRIIEATMSTFGNPLIIIIQVEYARYSTTQSEINQKEMHYQDITKEVIMGH